MKHAHSQHNLNPYDSGAQFWRHGGSMHPRSTGLYTWRDVGQPHSSVAPPSSISFIPGPSPKMFKLAILASLLVAASAMPAVDLDARARTTETYTDYGCVKYLPTTITVHDPRTTSVTTTKSVYPPGMKRQGGWDTIVESVVCASTMTYPADSTTVTDPAITVTRTAFASTETHTDTYTLCVGSNVCA
ncbi:hypothetical protein BD626DRAFT_515349 [Schizophyllum amplum]|uniref:Uncharacterized protein n=1 Tax=Schizophyllum amplum TaxID=97359 RepID=A0A550BXS5_9AGAR|nr:hypothetical protein BD626DRAFT_515349 [Auriculariopsis ampla]